MSAARDTLKIASLAATQAFLGQAAALEPAQRQEELLKQIQLLTAADVQGTVRLNILEALLGTVLETQYACSREYWGTPVPFDGKTRETFERSVALWRTLADAYESLVADMAGKAPELAEYAEVVCYRALRCAGYAMIAHNRAYYEVPGALWEQLHRMYAFAESAGVTDIPVAEGASGRSTVTLAYLQTVLAQRAKPDSLSLMQMSAVDRALAQWVGSASVSPDPVMPDRARALGVDLDSNVGARRLDKLKGTNLRYFDLSAIDDKLQETAVALLSVGPDKLGLGQISRAECESLLRTLAGHWIAPGAARVDERKEVSFNVLVSSTLAAIHHNISGKAFKPPDAGLSSRERYDAAGFQRVEMIGEASVRSRTLETWTVANQSASGMLGMCRKPSDQTKLTHNQLLGLVAPNGKTLLGKVQRLSVDADGVTWLGMRVLAANVQTVAARVANSTDPYDRALLIEGDADQQAKTIIVAPGTYETYRILDLYDGTPRRIRLTALVDSGSNFERATFTNA